MKDIFIETTKGGNYFANISRELIENKEIRYLFPMNKDQVVCYKINRAALEDLVDSGYLFYNSAGQICEKDYGKFFEIRSVAYTKKMVEHWGHINHF